MADVMMVDRTVDARTFVALSPAEMVPAQQGLAAWCQQKVLALSAERSDLIDSALVAKQNNWAHESLTRLAKKVEARIVYYQKIQAAVEAGYLIVPNFDVEIMAVRVHGRPVRQTSTYESLKITEATADLLPVGEGRYVDNKLSYRDNSYETPDPKHPGTLTTVGAFITDDYRDTIDFPVLAAKPTILDATARAMSRKIFDRIGVVSARKEDPLVVGQIIHPQDKNSQHFSGLKRVSFFIAWWLDTSTL